MSRFAMSWRLSSSVNLRWPEGVSIVDCNECWSCNTWSRLSWNSYHVSASEIFRGCRPTCLLPYPVLRETVVIQKMKEFYMVIGGSGFLGRHIVQQLVDRGDNVCIFDIVQRYFDVPFYPGDITNIDDVTNALQKVWSTVIFRNDWAETSLEWDYMHYSHRFSVSSRSYSIPVLQS